nr:hypothetical protein [Pseudomonas sp. Irchel 3E20]
MRAARSLLFVALLPLFSGCSWLISQPDPSANAGQTLHANGHAPQWSVTVNGKGLLLERAGQAPLALPYLEEQAGEGRFSLTSDANGQHIELWVAPQRCVDAGDSTVRPLSAELRINGQVQRGCGYFDGARSG